MRVRLLIFVLATLLLVTLSSSTAGQQNSPTPAPSADPPKLTTLPKGILDAELKAAHGRSFKLSKYLGKVLVVNLWATWCGPCRLETPALVKLHKKFRSHGLEVVELSTENPEISSREVRSWIRNFGVHYKVGWATPELALTMMQGRDAIPQTFVLSRTGRIVKRFIGFNQVNTPTQWKRAIEEALNEKPDLPE